MTDAGAGSTNLTGQAEGMDARLFSSALSGLYAIAALAGIAMGVFSPLVSLYMDGHGASETAIGANTTVYFLVLALLTPLVMHAIVRFGVRRVMLAGLALTAVAGSLFAWSTGIGQWFILRGVMGGGVCAYTVAVQVALNRCAPDAKRAAANGLYALAFSVGLALGPLIGPGLYALGPIAGFAGGGAIVASGLLVAAVFVPLTNAGYKAHRRGLWMLLPGPMAAAAAYGVAEASLFSLFPVRMAHGGYDPQAAGVVFSVLVAGSIILTLPVSRLGDRFGKTLVLRASLFAAFLSLLSMTWVNTYWALLAAAFPVGGSLGAIFSLALAVIGERLPVADLPGGSALFTAAFSGGAAVGPGIAGYLMHSWGHMYLFAPTLALLIVLVICLGWSPRERVGVH